jgi:hypothetical protein
MNIFTPRNRELNSEDTAPIRPYPSLTFYGVAVDIEKVEGDYVRVLVLSLCPQGTMSQLKRIVG